MENVGWVGKSKLDVHCAGKLRQDDPACRSRLPLHRNEGQVLFSLCISSTLLNVSLKVGEGGRGGQGLDKETG